MFNDMPPLVNDPNPPFIPPPAGASTGGQPGYSGYSNPFPGASAYVPPSNPPHIDYSSLTLAASQLKLAGDTIPTSTRTPRTSTNERSKLDVRSKQPLECTGRSNNTRRDMGRHDSRWLPSTNALYALLQPSSCSCNCRALPSVFPAQRLPTVLTAQRRSLPHILAAQRRSLPRVLAAQRRSLPTVFTA